MQVSDETVRGRTILVTGADGFIGSHLCERLVREGAKVRALVQYNSFGSWGWLDQSDIKDSIDELRYYRSTLFVPHPGPDTDAAKAAAEALRTDG